MSAREAYLQATGAIPAGETRSFGELAALAGRPGAARAAGRAIAQCPLESAYPWHRVVSADGALSRHDARRTEQLRRLRAEGARPREGEAIAEWAARTEKACVANWRRRVCADPTDPRVRSWPAERIEGFADRESARARGFRWIDDDPARAEAPSISLPPPERGARGPRAPLPDRIAELDWDALVGELLSQGLFRVSDLLAPRECRDILEAARAPHRFDRSVDMTSRGFGVGRYHYWKEPLPKPLETLREALYARLLEPARAHRGEALPPELAGFWERCREAGQHRASSILLCYGEGGVNHPHRDIYGPVWFPFQALIVLSRRGEDFEGGEFLLYEGSSGVKEAAHCVAVDEGDLVVFASRSRVEGGQGRGQVPLRHGMAPVTRGTRYAAGLVFHLAR